MGAKNTFLIMLIVIIIMTIGGVSASDNATDDQLSIMDNDVAEVASDSPVQCIYGSERISLFATALIAEHTI